MKKVFFVGIFALWGLATKAQSDSALNQDQHAVHPDMQDYADKKAGLNSHNGSMGTGTVTGHHYTHAKKSTGHSGSHAKTATATAGSPATEHTATADHKGHEPNKKSAATATYTSK